MFGYIVANAAVLSEEEKRRYQAVYCGLCREIGKRSGQTARLSLTYDLTFLILLLSSLYEPEEREQTSPCVIHARKRPWVTNRFTEYAADMNVFLSYYKLLDDKKDGDGHAGRGYARMLERQSMRIEALWPRPCGVIREKLDELADIEKRKEPLPDAAANGFGELMGELFVYDPDDYWADTLRAFGQGLGRFVYLMDAAVDYAKDKKSGSYNPLVLMDSAPEDMRSALTLLMGEAVCFFERLPLERDLSLMRNILYGGVWQRFNAAYPMPEKEAADG